MAETAGALPSVWDRIDGLFRGVRIALAGLAVLFAGIVFCQVAWLYQQARAVHPWLAFSWLVLVAGGVALVGWPAYRFFQVPRIVRPPDLPESGPWAIVHVRAQVRYLRRYLQACLGNPELAGKTGEIQEALRELDGFARDGDAEAIRSELGTWAARRLPALLKDLDQKADRLIYREALAVGLATAASPNGALDAFVMLWRSIRLVSRVAELYYGRPGWLGTLAICRDVSVATALAGYLQGISDSLGTVLARSLGGVSGLVAGPAVDGITNALVLIRIGYLARERCRSQRKWGTTGQRSALLAALAASQRVAVGLVSEILRQLGIGLGAAAGAVASGVGSAFQNAIDSLGAVFSGRKERAGSDTR